MIAMSSVRLGSMKVESIAARHTHVPNFSHCESFHSYFAARYMPINGMCERIRGPFSSFDTATSFVNSFSKFLRVNSEREMRGFSHLNALYIPLPRSTKRPKNSINRIP
jgi:phosphopantetheine adenylyltransferase